MNNNIGELRSMEESNEVTCRSGPAVHFYGMYRTNLYHRCPKLTIPRIDQIVVIYVRLSSEM